jgi:hypothetical protein
MAPSATINSPRTPDIFNGQVTMRGNATDDYGVSEIWYDASVTDTFNKVQYGTLSTNLPVLGWLGTAPEYGKLLPDN